MILTLEFMRSLFSSTAMESERRGLEGLENKRVWRGGASVAKQSAFRRALRNGGIIKVLQIYDDGLSVSSGHRCVHRNALTPFMNHRSVCLMNVSENVHPAFLKLVQRRR